MGVWARRRRSQNKGDGWGGGSCELTQGEVVGAQEDGNTGKTFPFVLEHLNVASGQGLGQRGSLSLWPGQPPSQPSSGYLACRLGCQKPFHPSHRFRKDPLGEAASASPSPRALSRAQAAFSEKHKFQLLFEWIFNVSLRCAHLDFGQSELLNCFSDISRIQSLRSKRLFPSLFSWSC